MLATAPVFGHHAFAAEYDALTPVVTERHDHENEVGQSARVRGEQVRGARLARRRERKCESASVERVGGSVADRRQGIRD
jgi:hypothetical protein